MAHSRQLRRHRHAALIDSLLGPHVKLLRRPFPHYIPSTISIVWKLAQDSFRKCTRWVKFETLYKIKTELWINMISDFPPTIPSHLARHLGMNSAWLRFKKEFCRQRRIRLLHFLSVFESQSQCDEFDTKFLHIHHAGWMRRWSAVVCRLSCVKPNGWMSWAGMEL